MTSLGAHRRSASRRAHAAHARAGGAPKLAAVAVPSWVAGCLALWALSHAPSEAILSALQARDLRPISLELVSSHRLSGSLSDLTRHPNHLSARQAQLLQPAGPESSAAVTMLGLLLPPEQFPAYGKER